MQTETASERRTATPSMKVAVVIVALLGAVFCDPTVYFKEEFGGKKKVFDVHFVFVILK